MAGTLWLSHLCPLATTKNESYKLQQKHLLHCRLSYKHNIRRYMKRMVHKWKAYRVKLTIQSIMLVIIFSFQTVDAGPASSEYKLKAALIFKLTRFVEWPKQDNQHDDGSFGICILGRDDFGPLLDALRKRYVNNTPISIHRFIQSEGINENCQLVFISDSKRSYLKSIIKALADRPILTIGESKKFAVQGGMIQFVRNENRIGFKINVNHVHSAGLKISAPLLELATIVNDNEKDTIE
jgi:hypothetical protein